MATLTRGVKLLDLGRTHAPLTLPSLRATTHNPPLLVGTVWAANAGGSVIRSPVRLLAGEPFFCEQEDGTFYIRHREWSLMGTGETEEAALQNLRAEAEELHEVLAELPPESLSTATSRMRDFLPKLL